MTTFDLSPLLRSSVGFDAFDNIFDSVFNLNESSGAYPPYNIVKSGNNYTITVAVAGFSKSDLDISVQENELVIKGSTNDSNKEIEFLHRGIAGRNFERKFRFSDLRNIDIVIACTNDKALNQEISKRRSLSVKIWLIHIPNLQFYIILWD